MLDLRQLRALRAVAATGSVARAAERLGWSQPTVNHHLQNLDRLVGAPLTTRTPRGTVLTTAGALMTEYSDELLGLADRALTDVRDLAELGRTRVRFGTFPTAAAWLLPSVVSRMRGLGIELDTTLAEVPVLADQVLHHRLDAALLYRIPGLPLPLRPEIHVTPVFTDPLLLALPAHHPLALEPTITADHLGKLTDSRWVLGSTPNDAVDALVYELLGHQGPLDVSVRTDDYAVVLGLIAADMGIAIVPGMVSASAPAGVVLRPLADPRSQRELILVAPGDPATHSARTSTQQAPQPATTIRHLADAVRRAVAELSAGSVHGSRPA